MEFFCGCIGNKSGKDPVAKRSDYFEDVSASFALNHSGPKLVGRYSWLIEQHCDLPPNVYIEAELENPSDISDSIRVKALEIKDNRASKNRRFYVISPPLDFIECRNYQLRLKAFSDSSRSKLITEHDNFVRSRVDTENCPTEEFMEKMNKIQDNWKNHSPSDEKKKT